MQRKRANKKAVAKLQKKETDISRGGGRERGGGGYRGGGGGSAPCHLVKLVLLGEQRVGEGGERKRQTERFHKDDTPQNGGLQGSLNPKP